MQRRILALFMLALLLTAGCFDGTVPAPQIGRSAPTTIHVGIFPNDATAQGLDSVIAAFEEKYPEYRVEKVILPVDNVDLVKALDSGNVDLVPGGGAHLLVPIRMGLLADLTPFVRTPGFSTAGMEWFLSAQNDQSRILELPYAAVPTAVLYNRDLVAAAGVSIPQNGWTWDQFRDVARSLKTTADGQTLTWGFATYMYSVPVTLWVNQAAGAPLGQPSTESLPNALRYFSEAIFLDRSMMPTLNIGDPALAAVTDDPFFAGRAAMTIGPLPDGQQARDLRFAWDVAPIPNHLGARPLLYVVPRTMAVSGRTPDPRSAWQFLKFLTGREAAVILGTAGFLPSYPAEEGKRAWLESRPGLPPSIRKLLDAEWVTTPWSHTAGTRDGLIVLATHKALSGAVNWEKAAADYVKGAEAAGIR